MKIVVDKMPSKPNECKYCGESKTDDVYFCRFRGVGSGKLCRYTSECPFFIGLDGSSVLKIQDCGDCISREAALNWAHCHKEGSCPEPVFDVNYPECANCCYNSVDADYIRNLPSVYPVFPKDATNEEVLNLILPENAYVSVDKRGGVHIRGIDKKWLDMLYGGGTK